jgi:hypothetical protein
VFTGHRCRRCKHPDTWSAVVRYEGSSIDHDEAKLRRRHCGILCPACHTDGCDWGPPIVIARYDHAGERVQDWAPPGTETTGLHQGWQQIYACSCEACLTMYRDKRDPGYQLPTLRGEDHDSAADTVAAGTAPATGATSATGAAVPTEVDDRYL